MVPLFAVYVTWCSKTNMHYVGITGKDVWTRIRQHKKGKKQFIDREIQKLGWEGNFDWWIVEEGISSELISEREQHWVAIFDSVFPNGYNKTIGGIKHFKHSKKTCEQIGNSHRGQKRAPFTEEHKANLSEAMSGEKNPNYGKPARNRGVPCTEEAKGKIRKKLTGRKRPDQFKRMKGENNPDFGKPMPEETKGKLRAKALARYMSGENNPHYGKRHTEEVKAAQSARMKGENNPMYGKRHTEEAKGKNRQVHLGKPGRKGIPCSEEAKAKLRVKALTRAARKRVAKAVAEENLAVANPTPKSLSILSNAVVLQ